MKGHRIRALELLVSIDTGLFVASLNWRLLSLMPASVHDVLLGPKRLYSAFIGRLQGWDEHVIYHDPIGMWLQLATVAFASCLVSMGLLTARRKCRADANAMLDSLQVGLTAFFAPWVVWLMAVEWPQTRPNVGGAIIVSLGLLAALGLGVRSVVLLRQRAWYSARGAILVGMLSALGVWIALVERSTDTYGQAIAYGALLTNVALLGAWAPGRATGEREPGGALSHEESPRGLVR